MTLNKLDLRTVFFALHAAIDAEKLFLSTKIAELGPIMMAPYKKEADRRIRAMERLLPKIQEELEK